VPRYHGDDSTTHEWSYGLPRLGDNLLDLVFYVYPNKAAAESGTGAGGTGFFVAVRSEAVDTVLYLYAVTNSHVIKSIPDREGEHPHLRMNGRGGTWLSGKVPKTHWVHHPNLDDVAVLSFTPDTIDDLAIRWLLVDHFATREVVEKYQIGPGDAVCMIGRFVNHEGREKNLPSVRFGNISMMPWQPIQHEWGYLQESYLVECRSLPGYSGSPVLVYQEPLQLGFKRKETMKQAHLLGIDWCHPPNWRRVRELDPKTNQWVERADMKVDTNSGMAGVIPAWTIKEILDGEPFMRERKANDQRLSEKTEGTVATSALDESPRVPDVPADSGEKGAEPDPNGTNP
jgi:hypothetical protein